MDFLSYALVRFVGWDKRNTEKAPELFYRFFLGSRFFREMNGKMEILCFM